MKHFKLWAFTLLTCLSLIYLLFPQEQVVDKRVKDALDYLLKRESFAYTLIGSKPVSIIDLPGQHPRTWIYPGLPYACLKKDLASLYDLKKSHGKRNAFEFFRLKRGETTTYVLVNRRKVKTLVKKHPESFPKCDIEKILDDEEAFLGWLFSKNDRLGLLLGYGRINSTNFYLYFNQGAKFLKPLPDSLDYSTLPIDQIPLPYFMPFQGGEPLQKKYQMERQKILQSFPSSSQALKLLMS